MQAAGKQFLLAVGQVQRFALRIVEKGIALHAFGQRRAVYQVGVENQAGHVHRLFFVDYVHLHRLPGSETHHRAFLVIVLLAAVAQRAIHAVLYEQGVNAVVHLYVVDRFPCLVHIHHRYERVKRGQAVKIVVSLNAVKLYYFHNALVFSAKLTHFSLRRTLLPHNRQ